MSMCDNLYYHNTYDNLIISPRATEQSLTRKIGLQYNTYNIIYDLVFSKYVYVGG